MRALVGFCSVWLFACMHRALVRAMLHVLRNAPCTRARGLKRPNARVPYAHLKRATISVSLLAAAAAAAGALPLSPSPSCAYDGRAGVASKVARKRKWMLTPFIT